jgi:hypothetical protein
MAIACRILRDVDLAEHAVQAALVTAWLGEQIRQIVNPIRFDWARAEGSGGDTSPHNPGLCSCTDEPLAVPPHKPD